MDLYSFVYKGILTDEALDGVGRRRRNMLGVEEMLKIQKSLSYDLLDIDHLVSARRMALVYTAIHAFENGVRNLVTKAMIEKYPDAWWEKVPPKIRDRARIRMAEDARFKWHGSRGSSEITYCDFGDLSSIIVTNWDVFEDVLGNMEWAKGVMSTLEKSRNIVMHGGELAGEDIERIGMNIRDWIRQSG